MEKPTRATDLERTGAATYRIRVAGALDEEWSRRAQGMTLSVHRGKAKGTFTELVGGLADEAALMGVLEALYTYGVHLLSVEHVDEGNNRVVKLDHSPKAPNRGNDT